MNDTYKIFNMKLINVQAIRMSGINRVDKCVAELQNEHKMMKRSRISDCP